MTERQKWLKIAKAYLTPLEERTISQHYLTRVGLCRATGIVGCAIRASGIEYLFQRYVDEYWWPTLYQKGFKTEYDHYKGMVALFIAYAPKRFLQGIVESNCEDRYERGKLEVHRHYWKDVR